MIKHLVVAAVLLAQWLNYPAPGVPRLPNGKVDLSAKAPRTRDGKPDLSGVWQTELATPEEIARRSDAASNALIVPGDDFRTWNRYFLDILADFKPDERPLTPEGAEMLRRNSQPGVFNPTLNCLPDGVPKGDLLPELCLGRPGFLIVPKSTLHLRLDPAIARAATANDPIPTWNRTGSGH